ncbi:hypothetical protein [Lactobacillus terrae]|uniref:hypothetical protein n=1 Tax=Lactobacillus terrae TaxID=2269374 RepID=UPI000C1B7B82|nr:hypothetical protein [Lactobacillus terrae]
MLKLASKFLILGFLLKISFYVAILFWINPIILVFVLPIVFLILLVGLLIFVFNRPMYNKIINSFKIMHENMKIAFLNFFRKFKSTKKDTNLD